MAGDIGYTTPKEGWIMLSGMKYYDPRWKSQMSLPFIMPHIVLYNKWFDDSCLYHYHHDTVLCVLIFLLLDVCLGSCEMPESQRVCESDKEIHWIECTVVVPQYCRTLCSWVFLRTGLLPSEAGSYDRHPWQQIPTIWLKESNKMALCVQVTCKLQCPDADSECLERSILTQDIRPAAAG